MIIDGLPLELTMLPGNKIEIYWPVGMHDHAKRVSPYTGISPTNPDMV